MKKTSTPTGQNRARRGPRPVAQEPRQADIGQTSGVAGPSRLFNSSLVGDARRATDIHERDTVFPL